MTENTKKAVAARGGMKIGSAKTGKNAKDGMRRNAAKIEGARDGEKEKRGRRKGLSVHPLFLLLGAVYCFTGELPAFLLSAAVALQHECAHAFAAARLGYKLDRVVLMPYGAVIDGDLRGISFRDEIYVAVWGPLCNLLTAAAFAALWWFYPDTYAFTDGACFVSLAIALINLIPAYPLDGGRVLRCALALYMDEKRAEKICRVAALTIAAGMLVLFGVAWAGGSRNFTPAIFAVFLAAGAAGNGKSAIAAYEKINFSSKAAFRRGVEVCRVAVDESCTLRRAIRFIRRDKYLILDVYGGDERYLGEIRQNELAELFACSEIYAPLSNFFVSLSE